MSYSPPANYTDGVPIKISEKYKPPPAVHLPTRIIQQLAKTEVPVAFEDYNFDLEHKIISKTSEWINWRSRDKSERLERIHQRELARLKHLEEEQKRKLNQVSYPSTDDEDEELTNEATNSHSNQQQQIIPNEKPFSPTNFNTILMPTQALQDPVSVKKSHRRFASNSSNKIDFSFFESDTSPFDHLEMKSMNEMELLAQVLGSSTKGQPQDVSNLERNSSSESESSDHQKNNNNVSHEPAAEMAQHQPQQPQYQQSYAPHSYNNYYGMREASQGYYYPASNVTATQTPLNFSQANHQNQFLYTQSYAVNYDYNNYRAMVNNNNTIVNGTSDKTEVSSKSKSVPSILMELNDELNNSEKRRRIRNNSQNSPKEVTQKGESRRCLLIVIPDCY